VQATSCGHTEPRHFSTREHYYSFSSEKEQSFRHTWKTDRSQRHRLPRDSEREAEGSGTQFHTGKNKKMWEELKHLFLYFNFLGVG
jgi:hypothetical protein